MILKQILGTSTAALALAVAGAVFAAQSEEAALVSGATNPVDQGDAAQLKAPASNAAAQAKTEAMLKKESGDISGNLNPVDQGDATQMKAPTPKAAAQEKTEEILKKEAKPIGGY